MEQKQEKIRCSGPNLVCEKEGTAQKDSPTKLAFFSFFYETRFSPVEAAAKLRVKHRSPRAWRDSPHAEPRKASTERDDMDETTGERS
jgi:hypothetical protein